MAQMPPRDSGYISLAAVGNAYANSPSLPLAWSVLRHLPHPPTSTSTNTNTNTNTTTTTTTSGPVAIPSVRGERRTPGYVYVCHERGCGVSAPGKDEVSRHWGAGGHGAARKKDPRPGDRFAVREDVWAEEEGRELAAAVGGAEEFVEEWWAFEEVEEDEDGDEDEEGGEEGEGESEEGSGEGVGEGDEEE